jgi:acetyl esterase/lipase
MEARGDRKHPFGILTVRPDLHFLREDKNDHAALARKLVVETSCAVVLPNYRLTKPETGLRHPAHAEDLLAFLHFVLVWPGPPGFTSPPYDPSRAYILGHSCSAHMATSILLMPPPSQPNLPSLKPSDTLLASVRGVIMSEGIYDVDRLLMSFPRYKDWFIANTFGDLESYAQYNTAAYNLRNGERHIRWLVLHSKGDPLVDEVQSQSMIDRLETLYPSDGSDGNVESYLELKSEHNDVLAEEKYHEVVRSFIARTETINRSVA